MRWLLGIAGAILAIYVLWSWVYPTYTVRWRLTIEIETPHGVRSGSSVLESSFFRTSGAVGGASARLRGEAVFVDLGDGRAVIAALAHGTKESQSDRIKALPVTALTGAGWGWGAYTELEERSGFLEGEAVLEQRLIPPLVTFADMNDPKTVRILDPRGDDFEQMFGSGTRFKRAKIEIVPKGWWPLALFGITGVKITAGIADKIPWILTLNGRNLSGNKYCNMTNKAESCLRSENFRSF